MIGAVLKIAMRALARNKGRSALTMLGIIIGVASVIAMVGLGQGAQKQVQQQIESMGTNMLIISAGSQRSGGVRGGAGTSTTLTPDDLDAIVREAPAVSAISPSVSVPVTLVFGNGNWSTRAEGVAPSTLAIRNRSVASGEFFTEADVRTAARVAVLGETVSRELFAGGDPVGQTVRVRNLPFRVVGVLCPKGRRSGAGSGRHRADSVHDGDEEAAVDAVRVTSYVSRRARRQHSKPNRRFGHSPAEAHSDRVKRTTSASET